MNKPISNENRPQNGYWMLLLPGLASLLLGACSIQPTCNDPKATFEDKAMRSKSTGNKISDTTTQPKTAAGHRLEPLHAFAADAGEIAFSVTSTGCTRLDDFSIETDVSAGQCSVAIYRVRADRCRRAPTTIDLKMTWNLDNQCKPGAVTTSNPMIAGTPPHQKPVYK